MGESYTTEYLVKNGYTILCRNYRKPCGEIDVIACKGDIIAFVEVKTRKLGSLQSGIEAVDYRKKGKIIKTADWYFAENGMELQPRYDIAEVTITPDNSMSVVRFEYYEDAFDTTGYETQF